MAHSEFSVDGPALERSTAQVIQPNHIMRVQEDEEVLEAGVDTQLFQIPPAPQEEQEQAGHAQENSLVLTCIMGDSRDPFHVFQEWERYLFGVNSGSDSDVPEDELSDEMEDISCDKDQLAPVSLQEKEGPPEEDHGAVNLPVPLVNVQVTEPEDPSIPRHLDEMEDIVAVEEDQLVPVNWQEAKHFTEGDHDKPSPLIIPVECKCSEEDPVNLPKEEDHTFQGDSDQLSPGSIPLEDITAIHEDQLDPANLQVEEDRTQGDHDQPSRPGIIQLEDIITAIEGNETGPQNLQVTWVNLQVTEPKDPNTSRLVGCNIATLGSVYREAGQDVKVQTTVITTSAAKGESSSSGQILMDIHVDPKSPESEDSYELLPEAIDGDSPDSKGVNETGAPATAA